MGNQLFRWLFVITLLAPLADAKAQAHQARTDTATHNVSVDSTEIVVLRAQLQLMKETDARLLSTVHWALGLTTAIALALVGFGWYANFRLQEREIASLRREIEQLVQSSVSGAHGDISKKVLADVEEQVNALQTRIDERVRHLYKGINMLVFDKASDEAVQREREGSLVGALSSYNLMAAYAIQLEEKEKLARCLDNIVRVLKAGAAPTAAIAAQLNKTLDKLPKEHGSEAAIIKELIHKNRV